MQKKLTLTIAQDVYAGLHRVVGRRKISRFVEDLVRPHVLRKELESAYREMASDKAREEEAFAWCEATCGDASDETR